VAGVVTAAVLTAGAVEVKQHTASSPADPQPKVANGASLALPTQPSLAGAATKTTAKAPEAPAPTPAPPESPVAEDEATPPAEETAGESAAREDPATVDSDAEGLTPATPSEGGGSHAGGGTVVVTVAPPPPSEAPPGPATEAPPGSPSEAPPGPATEASPAGTIQSGELNLEEVAEALPNGGVE
jgi:hypothetical protein